MHLSCEIKSRDIIPGDMSKSLAYMSRKVSSIVDILKQYHATNIHAGINPDEGFLLTFDCEIYYAEEIFRKIKIVSLK